MAGECKWFRHAWLKWDGVERVLSRTAWITFALWRHSVPRSANSWSTIAHGKWNLRRKENKHTNEQSHTSSGLCFRRFWTDVLFKEGAASFWYGLLWVRVYETQEGHPPNSRVSAQDHRREDDGEPYQEKKKIAQGLGQGNYQNCENPERPCR